MEYTLRNLTSFLAAVALAFVGLRNGMVWFSDLNAENALYTYSGSLLSYVEKSVVYQPKYIGRHSSPKTRFKIQIYLKDYDSPFIYENDYKIRIEKIASLLKVGEIYKVTIFKKEERIWGLLSNGKPLVSFDEEKADYKFWMAVNFIGGGLFALAALVSLSRFLLRR